MQYYTLEQAAQILKTTPDKVKEMARKGEVRAFQDRGNLRFRGPEIDELARARGLGSDPGLTPGPEPTPPAAGPKSPPPGSQKRKSKIPPQQPAAMAEDEEAPIGREPLASGSKGGSSARRSPSPAKPGSGRRPTMTPAGPKSPPPKAASDSDVRLVAEGSDLDFQVVPEQPKAPGAPPSSKSGSGARKPGRSSRTGKSPDPADSGVRIVPLEEASDSDVKLEQSGVGESAVSGPKSGQKPSDSDIRLDDGTKPGKAKPESGEHPITEEIDLDEEQRRADASTRTKPGTGKARPKANPLNLPNTSPFELSEGDIDVDKPAAKQPRPAKPEEKGGETDSSEDFELTPVGQDDSSPVELSSSEVEALKAGAGDESDEVGLGELTGAGAAQSGINLQDPADSGISLEQGGSDEIEFELSLDSGATPKPGTASKEGDSSNDFELAEEGSGSSSGEGSSEFELALDSADAPGGEEESSSEFELSLDVDDSGEAAAAQAEDSDSEFELTLDSEGGADEGGGEQKDIFETDFEVPALEDEESSSEAAAVEDEDTDLETSDFDLALDEEGAAEEDPESGSQVVALEDEGEVDEAAETEARPRRRGRQTAMARDEDEGELDLDLEGAEAEEEEEEAPAAAAAPAAPTPWGSLPALLLIPTVLIMFFVGLLAFELAGSMWGYRQPGHTTGVGMMLHPLAKYFDNSLPD